MTPYYHDAAAGITIYHGRAEDVLPTIEPAGVALLLADPPYGVGVQTEYRQRKRTALARCNDFPRIVGDAEPFDPAPLLRFPRLVLFGANHYADRLPASSSWLVWDKVAGLPSSRPLGFNDNADAELAWTNLGGPVRLLPLRWMGCMKATERASRRVHPTQKPVALMVRIIELYTNPGDLVLDPYMGSGPIPAACKLLGRRCIAVEIDRTYCDHAVDRLAQAVLPLFDVPDGAAS